MEFIVFQIQDGGGFFSQSGAELRIKDGEGHKSQSCWKSSLGPVSEISMATQITQKCHMDTYSVLWA